MVCWLGVRLDRVAFAIFDAFVREQAREIHLAGTVAEALADRAGDLLVGPTEIRNLDVLSAKLEASQSRLVDGHRSCGSVSR